MTDKNDLVSIIVPVYNTEKYLNDCVGSILAQTHKNIELILIDDGSTDGSGALCDEYALSDNRVKVIHQENKGVSRARNEGIAESRGDFITFVDSDDTIDSKFVETLYNGFNPAVDMTVCAFKCTQNQGGGGNVEHKETKTKTLTREEAIETVLYGKPFAGHSCNKMFRKSILDKAGFDENAFVYEDLLFVIGYLLGCKNVTYYDKELYNYYLREDSASHGKMTEKKITAFYALEQVEKKLTPIYKDKYTCFINRSRLIWAEYCFSILSNDKDNRDKYSDYLKKIVCKNRNVPWLSRTMKFKVFLLSVNTRAYYFMMKAVRKNKIVQKLRKIRTNNGC